jgi:ABC-type transport system involved in cytochrome c biogenesis ATPase subunit
LGHSASLYEDLTVTENVRFAVRASGADDSGVGDALDKVGLTGRLRRTTAGRLSAGQRRRVAMAALIAKHPELWLLDEPHAALDASARSLLDELVREAAGSGTTVLLVSHEPERARPLATQVVTMMGGRVVEPARAEQVPGGEEAAPVERGKTNVA